ncbi:MAG TPA: hypothetical protein VFD84_09980 [Candidatus Binatia bacterium]|nr:hypothetical protein [Candidatus Binatia bacterium]
MATEPVRIEIRGLETEVEDAQHDLRETLQALEERLLPRRAVRRLVTQHDPLLVIGALVAAGVALGFARDHSPRGRTVTLVAAGIAGGLIYRLTR